MASPRLRLVMIVRGVPPRGRYTLARRLVQLLVLILFALQVPMAGTVVEGSLASSRVLGALPMLDVFAWLEEAAASLPKGLLPSLESIIAVSTVVVLYAVLGRAFCGWVCPLDLLFSLFESKLARPRGRLGLSPHALTKRERLVPLMVALGYLALSAALSYPFFTSLSPVAAATKAASLWVAVAYAGAVASGLALAYLVIVVVALSVNAIGEKVFGVKRFWCKYACPVGAVYGLGFNRVSSLVVRPVAPERCRGCNVCGLACPMTIDVAGYARRGTDIRDPRCIKCGRCVEACPHRVLSLRLAAPLAGGRRALRNRLPSARPAAQRGRAARAG